MWLTNLVKPKKRANNRNKAKTSSDKKGNEKKNPPPPPKKNNNNKRNKTKTTKLGWNLNTRTLASQKTLHTWEPTPVFCKK